MSKLNRYILTFASLPVLVLIISFLRHGPPAEVKIEAPLEGTLEFVSNRRDRLPALQRLVQGFTDQYPGVTINIVIHDEPDGTLPPLMMQGRTPDITVVPMALPRADFPNYFLPLDELPFDGSRIRFFLDGRGPDGRLYSLSSQVNYVGLVYHRQAFEKAGIEALPRDWESFTAACTKLREAGIVPLEINYREPWALDRYTLYLPAMLSGNPSAINVLARRDALFVPGEPLQTIFEQLRELRDSGGLGPNWRTSRWTINKREHAAGNIGMTLLGSWYPPQLQAAGARPADLGAFPYPGSQAVLVVSDWHFAVSADTRHPRAAKAFLEYLIEGGRYARTVGGNSPLTGAPPAAPGDRELLASGLPTLDIVALSDAFRRRCAAAQVSLTAALHEYLAAKDPDAVLAAYNQRWAAAGAR